MRQGPLDFYYNKENEEVIYGERAISHYKRYPTSTHYEHIANFLEELQRMYNSHNIHQSITGNDLIIYEAIISFLTKLWLGNRIEEIYDLATTQFAFLLPMEDSDAGFVNNFLQPLLLKTPWLSTCDPKSKLIFINDLQAYLYSLQDPQHVDNINLQKEGRYLICNIQNMATRGRVTVELGAVQMVYDKDLVAASNKSILTLGSNPLLEPKSLCPTVRHTLSFVPSLNDMKNLAKFLFLKIFAESSDEKIGNDSYSDYCSDNKYYDKVLFEELLRLLRISINSNVSCGKCCEGQLSHYLNVGRS